MIKIGCCGWSYFRAKEFFGTGWKNRFESVLQAYSKLLPSCEVNSTFYRIPKVSTAEKWRKSVDKSFEFTVKASRLITHQIKFTKASASAFYMTANICRALNAKIMLLQSPASFKPTKENIERMKDFFSSIKRGKLILAWEPRGNWHKNPEQIKKVCKKFDLVECVDPFRNTPISSGKNSMVYFRLHGFGKPSMYNYRFSDDELKRLKKLVEDLDKDTWIMFNNVYMYEDALRFISMW